jgi:hypothetical protein
MRRHVLVTCALLASGCILPDPGIVIESERNEHPVRLIEPVATSLESACACDPNREASCNAEDPRDTWAPSGCSQPTASGLPHLLDPTDPRFLFCTCSGGFVDAQPLSAVEWFVDDQDRESGDPKDTLFAVLLLDARPEDDPSTRVAYTRYLNPNLPLRAAVQDYAPLAQPDPALRQVLVRDEAGRFDLCNGNGALSPGWHSLTVLVTDRPWLSFLVTQGDELVPFVQVGSPDLAGGATYDAQHFAFRCFDAADPAPDNPCSTRCIEPTGAGG